DHVAQGSRHAGRLPGAVAVQRVAVLPISAEDPAGVEPSFVVDASRYPHIRSIRTSQLTIDSPIVTGSAFDRKRDCRARTTCGSMGLRRGPDQPGSRRGAVSCFPTKVTDQPSDWT